MKRWTVAALAVTLLLSGCAAGGEPEATPPPELGPIDGRFSVGERELHLKCTGSRGPTVLLESGEGQGSDALEPIRAALGSDTHVCSYDRANVGVSDPAEVPRTAEEISADLDALLQAAGVPGPFVLVGHSAGGMFVQHYARTHLDNVTGVVAINPVPRYDWAQELMFGRMDDEQEAAVDAYYTGENDEGIDFAASSEQIASAPAPGQVPFSILISTVGQCDDGDDFCGPKYAGYDKAMVNTAEQWDHSGITTVGAGGAELDPDNSDLVATMINDLLITAG
ncbi:alpha/beta fold hydrolase [Lysobacter korlensis]|uniref:Alpha/beta fold hydrolase n=1 Tax=Lysobacter korlensis TaxID=553636 RepID=A0ABV6RNH3_9GAMM